MEVWVRSQDKRSFMKIEHISAEEIIVPNSRKTIWCVTANFGCIGEYPTKERCLEIIDEIQSFISFDKNVCTFTESGGGSFVYEDKVSCVIYTMPQE